MVRTPIRIDVRHGAIYDRCMRKVNPTQLRKDLYCILDQIINSGEGVEVMRDGGSVLLLAQKGPGKLANLKRRATIAGDPEDIDRVSWEGSWQPDST